MSGYQGGAGRVYQRPWHPKQLLFHVAHDVLNKKGPASEYAPWEDWMSVYFSKESYEKMLEEIEALGRPLDGQKDHILTCLFCCTVLTCCTMCPFGCAIGCCVYLKTEEFIKNVNEILAKYTEGEGHAEPMRIEGILLYQEYDPKHELRSKALWMDSNGYQPFLDRKAYPWAYYIVVTTPERISWPIHQLAKKEEAAPSPEVMPVVAATVVATVVGAPQQEAMPNALPESNAGNGTA